MLLMIAGDVETNSGPADVSGGSPGNEHVRMTNVLLGPSEELWFGHLNVRSILPKCQQLQMLLGCSTNLVFGVSETWLNDKIPNFEVEMPGLKV